MGGANPVGAPRRRRDQAATGQRPRRAHRPGGSGCPRVAGGATNREVASELFLSPKTIEFHLGRVYRKLGIHSRAELAAAAAEGRLEAEVAGAGAAPHPNADGDN